MGYTYTAIRIDRIGHVAEVVLNNPEKLNAMAPVFFEDIRQAFQEIDKDPEIRVAVLWAEGRLFTAGLDLYASNLSNLSEKESNSAASKNYNFYRHVRDLQIG